MPFTTRPAFTSRQAIMRLARVSQCTEILQDLHAYFARLLRMKLHTEEVVALGHRRKWPLVRASRNRVGADRRAIGVGEIHVGSCWNSRQQPRVATHRDAVPAHVRRFDLI